MIPRMKIINKYGINCIELFKENCKLYITSIYKKTIFQTKCHYVLQTFHIL